MKRPAAWVVLWSFRVFRVVHGGSRALFEGFWLGILPESVADITTVESYGEGDSYTRKQTVDSGLQFWEELAVQRFFPASGRVLVAAAGGGREMIALARAGYQVEGFECSPPMVQAGIAALRERGIDARLQWAPPSSVPVLSTRFDAAIVGWNAWSYIVPKARRMEFLSKLASHLEQGAPILVSAGVLTTEHGAARWIPFIANLVRRCTFRKGIFEVGTSFVTRPRQDYSPRTMRRELRECGFAAEHWYRWGPFGAIVGRKR